MDTLVHVRRSDTFGHLTMVLPFASADEKTALIDALTGASRPREIEEWSNLRLIHPVSRHLASVFIAAGIPPNAVSLMGAGLSVMAAASYMVLPAPLSGLLAFAGLIAAHMFDGADGLVARATGCQSTRGEIVDSLCDHAGFGAVYLVLGVAACQQVGWLGIVLALVAAASNVVQANAYEGQRRTYGHWVYGKSWIGTLGADELGRSVGGPFGTLAVPLARLYIWIYERSTAEDPRIDALMAACRADGGNVALRSRLIYRDWKAPRVRLWSLFGQNAKTVAMGLAMVFDKPVAYFLFVTVVLNPVLIGYAATRSWGTAALIAKLRMLVRATSA
jgi:phosphatidylglycerophosphate synthase